MTWSARITEPDYQRLNAHLHRDDRDEHAAFLFAGHARIGQDDKLLVHEVVPVADEDFGPSDRGGYRQISAQALARAAIACRAQGLRLLWAHNHPGARSRVSFSEPDRATHRRAHPHMIEMTGGQAVGSLVFGTDSVAGEVWLPDGDVRNLERLDVTGARFARLSSCRGPVGSVSARFDRQARMFGPEGQAALSAMTVAVVGAGGGGSLLIQALAHLGVGNLVVVDFDRVAVTNLSRIVGAGPPDARRRRLKVDVMRRLVRSIDPTIRVTAVVGDITHVDDARRLAGCDFIFSASDTQFARFAVNAVCHQYLIPGAQVGAKVVGDDHGRVQLAYAAYRPIDLGGACLECGGAIDSDALRREQLNETERRDQNYIDVLDADPLPDPSVITLNSAATALAMIDFQFAATGMMEPGTRLEQRMYHAPERALRTRQAVVRSGCRWCDRGFSGASFGRGDDHVLPLRPGASQGRRKRSLATVFRQRPLRTR